MTFLTQTDQMNRLVQFLEPDLLTVNEHFQGPPQMANGGYTAGLLAEKLGATPVEVTLRKPVPLSRSLTLDKLPDGTLLLSDEGQIIAEALPAELDLDVPEAPSFAQAIAAGQGPADLHDHPFPHCFVCGPQREEGDGLGIFPGRIEGRNLVAAPWVPDSAFTNAFGYVCQRYLWAALDCPGGWALSGQSVRPMVLGRITGTIERTVSAGENLIVIGWEIGRDGRKLYAGTALYTETGQLVGKAKAIWFEV